MTKRTSRPRQRRTPEQIAALVRDFRASGRSRVAFAREHGIPASTLDLWLRKHRTKSRTHSLTEFVALELPAAPVSPACYEVVFPSGVRLMIPAGFDASELTTVIAAVADC
jgi:transposase-like protein